MSNETQGRIVANRLYPLILRLKARVHFMREDAAYRTDSGWEGTLEVIDELAALVRERKGYYLDELDETAIAPPMTQRTYSVDDWNKIYSLSRLPGLDVRISENVYCCRRHNPTDQFLTIDITTEMSMEIDRIVADTIKELTPDGQPIR